MVPPVVCPHGVGSISLTVLCQQMDNNVRNIVSNFTDNSDLGTCLHWSSNPRVGPCSQANRQQHLHPGLGQFCGNRYSEE